MTNDVETKHTATDYVITGDAIRQAVRQRDLDRLKELLARCPALADETWEGLTLPFHAAASGNLDMVKYIVEYSRASFNETDGRNRTLLHYGVEAGNPELVRYLAERVGLSPVHGDADRITPYQLAHELAARAAEGEPGEAWRKIESYLGEVCRSSFEEMYRNPILTGMHPDPSIVCVGEDFYMVNSSFIFFPCIPILHSRDLLHWELIGHAVDNPEWAKNLNALEGGRGYWAPDISYYEGRYYITATFRLNDGGTVYRKQMVTSSERPEGPYCEPVYLDEDGIDPSIFTDDDGRRYMLLNRGARIFEISPDGKRQLSEAELLYYGHHKRAPEGSHLLKKDGYYYLFQAEGGTGLGHRISVARSRTLKGVYEPCPYNPIMRQLDEKGALQRCGHGKPVCTPGGEWFMVYLCGRQLEKSYTVLGRETAMDPITWTADGWPLVNGGQGPSVLQRKPRLPKWLPPEIREDYVTPRVPQQGMIVKREKDILLQTADYSLSKPEPGSILLKRQKEFNDRMEVELSIPEQPADGEEYGILCYYDENTWLSFGVCCMAGELQLWLREHVGDEDRERSCETEALRPGSKIVLRAETEGLKRSFYIRQTGEERCAAVLHRVDYLCDEGWHIGKRFTGAMEGIYARGDGRESRMISFSYF